MASNQTLRAVIEAIRANDPVNFLDDDAVRALASGLCDAGLCHSPPLLGSELDGGELTNANFTCSECGGALHARRSKHKQAKILHTSGMLSKRHVPLRCQSKVCTLKDSYVWHNYISRQGKHFFTGDVTKLRCLMVSSTFGCTMDWLNQFHLRLLREHATFVGEAFVARAFDQVIGCSEAPLARLRLNIADVWFKWRILVRLHRMRGDAGPRSLDLKKSVEQCAEQFWPDAHRHFHESTAAGVRDRGDKCDAVVMDANAKNRRLGCAAPYQHRLRNDKLSKSVRVPCPKTPKLGSLFFSDHAEWHDVCSSGGDGMKIVDHKKVEAVVDPEDSGVLLKINFGEGEPERWVKEEDVLPQVAFEYYRRVGEQDLQAIAKKQAKTHKRNKAWKEFVDNAMKSFTPVWEALSPEERAETLRLHSADADLSAVECSTHKEGDDCKAKCKHTAGVMCACLSNGVIIAFQECFGSESLSQRYLFLATVKELYPDFSIMIHDDACHLHKFADARKGESSFAAEIAPPQMRFICDVFHIAGHTDPWCLVTTHPKAEGNEALVAGVRTSVCEFTFTWLSQYKHASKHMSQYSFSWFMMEMMDAHNQFVASGHIDHLRT